MEGGFLGRFVEPNILCCFRYSSLWCHRLMTKQEAAVLWGGSPPTLLQCPPTRPTTPSSARPRTCTPTRRPLPWPPCPRLWTRCKGAHPVTAGQAGPTPPWHCYRRTAAWPWEGPLRDSTAATTNSSSSSIRRWVGSRSTRPPLLTRGNSTRTPTCRDRRRLSTEAPRPNWDQD